MRIAAAAATIGLALSLSACAGGATTTTAPGTTMPAATTAPTTAASPTASPTATASGDIVETATAAGDFKTLTSAVTAAGLADTLKGPGPFTVFAPTDAAFAKLPSGTVDTLLKEPTGKLAEILKYHVVSGKVMAADVATMNNAKVKTVEGTEFTVQVAGGKVSLTDAAGNKVNVVQTDVAASNGVIHVLDGVLMPE